MPAPGDNGPPIPMQDPYARSVPAPNWWGSCQIDTIPVGAPRSPQERRAARDARNHSDRLRRGSHGKRTISVRQFPVQIFSVRQLSCQPKRTHFVLGTIRAWYRKTLNIWTVFWHSPDKPKTWHGNCIEVGMNKPDTNPVQKSIDTS